jgi:hypothetical protein
MENQGGVLRLQFGVFKVRSWAAGQSEAARFGGGAGADATRGPAGPGEEGDTPGRSGPVRQAGLIP